MLGRLAIIGVAVLMLLPMMFSSPVLAFESYVARIPNGTVYGCDTCHSGSGTFQSDFNNNYKDWTIELADKDSDGDGFSNGVELLDPEGVWLRESPDPGDPGDVTHPNDPASSPPTGVRIGVATSALKPGDTFFVDMFLLNAEAPKTDVPLVLALEVGGQYWFWPSWSFYTGSSGFDYQVQPTVATGSTKVVGLSSFTWPDTGGATGSFSFIAAMLNSSMTGLDGELGTVVVTFGN